MRFLKFEPGDYDENDDFTIVLERNEIKSIIESLKKSKESDYLRLDFEKLLKTR